MTRGGHDIKTSLFLKNEAEITIVRGMQKLAFEKLTAAK
jgi:hypothetical protein